MKFAVQVRARAHARVQDSLPGTRQQSTAKWDVWEPPAAKKADRKKKQTLANGDMTCSLGRKLKQTINGPWSPSSTAAKYPALPLLPPPPLGATLAQGAWGGLGGVVGLQHFKTQAPRSEHRWAEWSGRRNAELQTWRPGEEFRGSQSSIRQFDGCALHAGQPGCSAVETKGLTNCHYHDQATVTCSCLRIRQHWKNERDKSGPTSQHIKLFPGPKRGCKVHKVHKVHKEKTKLSFSFRWVPW